MSVTVVKKRGEVLLGPVHAVLSHAWPRIRYAEPALWSDTMYAKIFHAGWGDMDFNAHMRNTAYLDKIADLRLMFLSENGFPAEAFLRLKIGPVVMKDEIEYFKEIHLQQQITVTCALAGHAATGRRIRTNWSTQSALQEW